MTPKDYQAAAQKAIPPSKSYKNIPMAFLVGGLLCVLGQTVINLALSFGLEKDIASACGSISLIIHSALLTGFNVYDNIAKHAGAGTLVPITGFANSMVSPAMEFKSEGLVPGTGAKIFTVAGPVIVYGTLSSVIAGIIYMIFMR